MYRTLTIFSCFALLGCRNVNNASISLPREGEKANVWIETHRLTPATAREVNAAKQLESHFDHQRTQSKDGLLSLTFVKGVIRMGSGGCYTTSKYEIRKADSDKVLATIPSTIFIGMEQKTPVQRAWFLKDGRIFIYETWNDGAGAHDMFALAVPLGNAYQIKYFDLPAFGIGAQEHGAVPVGIAGESIIFDPLTNKGYYKINILSSPHRRLPPIPFEIG